jgi:hypothetical protein
MYLKKQRRNLSFEILILVNIRTVFEVMVPCGLVKIYQCLRGTAFSTVKAEK